MDDILFALSILPVLVNGYDCRLSNGVCSQEGSSSLNGYSSCMVRQWSVSAFIQCASQKDAPTFTAKDDDGGTTDISPIDVLTNALLAPACSNCTLAHNLQKTADEHGSEDFATYLCNQFHPINAGVCCLRECLIVMPVEHSIKAFCAGNKRDLMNAPTLPESCGGDPSDDSNGESSNNSSDDDSSAAASSSDGSSSTEETISPSSDPTKSPPSSTFPTTSPIANNATPTSGMSTSPASQAKPSTGAASRRWVASFDRLNSLGLTVLPILAVF